MLDALRADATGYSLGGAAERERLSGIFGADNLKLGPVLAALAPFVLLAARARFGGADSLIAFVFVARADPARRFARGVGVVRDRLHR